MLPRLVALHRPQVVGPGLRAISSGPAPVRVHGRHGPQGSQRKPLFLPSRSIPPNRKNKSSSHLAKSPQPWCLATARAGSENSKPVGEQRARGVRGSMATDGEQAAAAAAGEVTPTKPAAEESEATGELLAPSGWTKKLNPTRGGRFDVVFVSPTGEEIKSKRQLTQYLKAHPGGPASSEFIWGTGNSLRRSARVCEKVKATESPESEKPPKRERSSSSKRGKRGKQEVAAETGDHGNFEEAKGTDVEMKEADTAQEKKEAGIAEEGNKEAENPPEEKKEDPSVDAAEKPEEGGGNTEALKLPVSSDGSTPVSLNDGDAKPAASEVAPSQGEKADVEMKEADTAQEEKKADPGVDAAEKPEEGEGKTAGLKLPVPSDGSTPVSLNEGDGKPAESEVAPLQGEKNENGQVPQSAVPPFSEGEKKEEVDSTTNPVTPPPVEVKADAVAAEVAKDAENSAVPEEPSTVNRDNKGQIQPGASTVRCT